VFKAIRGRDGGTRDFGRGRYENLSGAISWLTFFAGGAADQAKPKRLEAGTRGIEDLFSAKGEERSLFSPAGRQPWR
jgi:hypothetical protein